MAQRLYSVLGISRDASDCDVRSAYRRQALVSHPDKEGGSAAAFREVASAFETLSDNQLREVYNAELMATGSDDGLGVAMAAATPARTSANKRRHANSASIPLARKVPRAGGAATDQPASSTGGAATDQPASSSGASSYRARRTEDIEQLMQDLLSEPPGTWDGLLGATEAERLEAMLGLLKRKSTAANAFSERRDMRTKWPDVDCPEEHQEGDLRAAVLALCDQEVSAGTRGAQRKAANMNIRGVHYRCTGRESGKKYFGAVVHFNSMILVSPSFAKLDDAIDFHVSLVRIRQSMRNAGVLDDRRRKIHAVEREDFLRVDFATTLRAAVHEVNREREASGCPPLSIAYSVVLANGKKHKSSPVTKQLNSAIDMWSALQRIRLQKNPEELWSAALVEMRKRAQEERAQLRAQKPFGTQMYQKLEQKVRKALAASRKKLHERWGVKVLPEGIKEVVFCEAMHLSACLRLKAGTWAEGPPRRALSAAAADLENLQAVQRARGDAAAVAEAARLDAEVLTAYFAEGLSM